MARDQSRLVRCTSCRRDYEVTVLSNTVGCPDCGGTSWVSTLIAARDDELPAVAPA